MALGHILTEGFSPRSRCWASPVPDIGTIPRKSVPEKVSGTLKGFRAAIKVCGETGTKPYDPSCISQTQQSMSPIVRHKARKNMPERGLTGPFRAKISMSVIYILHPTKRWSFGLQTPTTNPPFPRIFPTTCMTPVFRLSG